MSFNIIPVASEYQEIHPNSAMNLDTVKINTSLIMMRECLQDQWVDGVALKHLRQEKAKQWYNRELGAEIKPHQICTCLNSDHTLEFELEVWNVWSPGAALSRVVSATPRRPPLLRPWHYHCLHLRRIQPLTSIRHQASKRPRVQVPPPPLISLATDSQKVGHCQPLWHLIH